MSIEIRAAAAVIASFFIDEESAITRMAHVKSKYELLKRHQMTLAAGLADSESKQGQIKQIRFGSLN